MTEIHAPNPSEEPLQGKNEVANTKSPFTLTGAMDRLQSLEQANLDALRKDVEVMKQGEEPKERFVLRAVLKSQGINTDASADLATLQGHFTKDTAEKFGMYFHPESNTWRVPGSLLDPTLRSKYLSTVASRNTLPVDFALSQEVKNSYARALSAIKVYDTLTEKDRPTDRALAQNHSEDWYVAYKTMQKFGHHYDFQWSDSAMQEGLKDAESELTSFRDKNMIDDGNNIVTLRSQHQRQRYNALKESFRQQYQKYRKEDAV